MEIEKLIELVRGHPVLYDTSSPDYMRTKMKDEVWEKIGTELNESGAAVKVQWKKLRDCHREAMRRQKKRKSGEAAVIQRPWTYQHQMEFLLPYMKNRQTQTNLEDTSYSGSPQTVEEPGDPPEEAIIENVTSLSNEGTVSEPTEQEIRPAKQGKYRKDHSVLQQFIKTSELRAKRRDEIRQQLLQQPSQLHQNDALYTFFLSMYTTTKSLSPGYQRQVRNKIFESVTQAEEQYEYEISQSPSFSGGSTPHSSRNSTTSATSPSAHDNLSQNFPEFFLESRPCDPLPDGNPSTESEMTVLHSL